MIGKRKNETSLDVANAPSISSLVNESQRLLLQASLSQDESAVHAWRRWQTINDLDSIDSHSFQLLPLLYLNLSRLGVKDPDMGRLRGVYKRTWTTNQLTRHSLLEVHQLLEAANVFFLLQRSLALVFFQYCDQGAIPIHEVGLLTKPEEAETVDSLLKKAGWLPRRPFPHKRLFPVIDETYYSHPKGKVLCLRWRPFAMNYSQDIETQFWDRSIETTFNDMTVKTMNPNDSLLLTTLEGYERQSIGMPRLLAEATILINSAGPSLDWEMIDGQARQLGKQDEFRSVLLYLHQELNIEIPHTFSCLTPRPEGFHPPSTLQLQQGPTSGGVGESLARMWNAYRVASRVDKPNVNPVEFIRFSLSYYQFFWGVRRSWLVPLVAVLKVFRRFGQSIGGMVNVTNGIRKTANSPSNSS